MSILKVHKYLVVIVLGLLFFQNNITKAIDKKEESINLRNYQNEYILGFGDVLFIKFKGLNLFTNNYKINQEGKLFLPELDYVFATGKTIRELRELLENKYEKYIINPQISIVIKKRRPISVTLKGEVNKVGLFDLDYKNLSSQGFESNGGFIKNSISEPINNITVLEDADLPPRLFDLIKLGMGITSNADLSNITVIRNTPKSFGDEKIQANIDLIKLLKEGDQSQNIILRDGDHVFVPRTEKVMIEQLIDINKSNLTPDTIEIFINGNVPKVGSLIVRQGLSLTEVIATAGGKQALSGRIEFIRLTQDGKVIKRKINSNLQARKGSKNNPILINGDIVYVRRNLLGKFGTALNEYTTPLINAYGVYKIFD